MSIARKILGNTLAQVAGRLGTAVLAVVVVKILTVYLGQAGYGQYVTVYEFLAFFGAFADFGIFTIAVREMSKHPHREREIFGNTLTLRTLFTATFMLVAAAAAFFIPQYQGTVIPYGVAIAAFSTFFVILSGTLSAGLQMRLRMEMAAIGLIIGKVVTVFLIVLLTRKVFPDDPTGSFYWLIWAGSFGALVTLMITWLVTARIFPVSFRFTPELIRHILKESFPFAIALALNTFYIRMDILMLSLLLPISEAGKCAARFCGDTEAGVYAVAARMMDILYMIPLYFMNSVLPTLTRSIGENVERSRMILKNAFHFLLAVGIPIGILLFILAKEIVLVVASPEFLSNADAAGSDLALRILAALVPIAFCSMFFGFILIATGKQATLIWINLLTVGFNLILDFFTIPAYGFVGAAYATLFSEFVMISLMVFFTRKVLPFNPEKKIAVSIFLAGAVCGALAWGTYRVLEPMGVVASILGVPVVFAACYFVALRKLGVVTPEILRMLKAERK